MTRIGSLISYYKDDLLSCFLSIGTSYCTSLCSGLILYIYIIICFRTEFWRWKLRSLQQPSRTPKVTLQMNIPVLYLHCTDKICNTFYLTVVCKLVNCIFNIFFAASIFSEDCRRKSKTSYIFLLVKKRTFEVIKSLLLFLLLLPILDSSFHWSKKIRSRKEDVFVESYSFWTTTSFILVTFFTCFR